MSSVFDLMDKVKDSVGKELNFDKSRGLCMNLVLT